MGVIRISGSALLPFALQLTGKTPTPRQASLTHFRAADGSSIDSGLLLYFPAPHSFTGEDVLELQGHGGPVVMQMYQSGEMSGNSGGLIRWPVWVALPVGFTLLLLQGWSELIKRVAFLRGVGPDPMGRLTDKSAEEELAEALRKQQAEEAQATPPLSAPR